MAKSRKSRNSRKGKGFIRRTANKTLPVVNKGLTTVGTTAKDVAAVSIPVIEKGVGVVYGTMATGLDLGVKGVKTVSKNISKRSRSRSASRSLAGGRRTRRHRKRH
jgi:hypothetical protein